MNFNGRYPYPSWDSHYGGLRRPPGMGRNRPAPYSSMDRNMQYINPQSTLYDQLHAYDHGAQLGYYEHLGLGMNMEHLGTNFDENFGRHTSLPESNIYNGLAGMGQPERPSIGSFQSNSSQNMQRFTSLPSFPGVAQIREARGVCETPGLMAAAEKGPRPSLAEPQTLGQLRRQSQNYESCFQMDSCRELPQQLQEFNHTRAQPPLGKLPAPPEPPETKTDCGQIAFHERLFYMQGYKKGSEEPFAKQKKAAGSSLDFLDADFDPHLSSILHNTKPSPLSVKLEVSSIKATVKWEKPEHVHPTVLEGYRVRVFGHKYFEDTFDPLKKDFLMELIPAEWYEVTVSAVSKTRKILASETFRFKAILSRDELFQLYEKSIDFLKTKPPFTVSLQDRMVAFSCFYRCKPRVYWQQCSANSWTMAKYMKDENGQPGNPINSVIPGLFFSAKMEPDGSIASSSIYGEIRYKLPASRLFNSQTRLYFCDFYCTYKTHYVTVVITERGSDSDAFCEKSLLELNIWDNEFLCIEEDKNSPNALKFWLNNTMWIEVYYTEDVKCNEYPGFGQYEKVVPMGKGTSTKGGLPNNKYCTVCNLYPLELPSARRAALIDRNDASRRRSQDSKEDVTGAVKYEPKVKKQMTSFGGVTSRDGGIKSEIQSEVKDEPEDVPDDFIVIDTVLAEADETWMGASRGDQVPSEVSQVITLMLDAIERRLARPGSPWSASGPANVPTPLLPVVMDAESAKALEESRSLAMSFLSDLGPQPAYLNQSRGGNQSGTGHVLAGSQSDDEATLLANVEGSADLSDIEDLDELIQADETQTDELLGRITAKRRLRSLETSVDEGPPEPDSQTDGAPPEKRWRRTLSKRVSGRRAAIKLKRAQSGDGAASMLDSTDTSRARGQTDREVVEVSGNGENRVLEPPPLRIMIKLGERQKKGRPAVQAGSEKVSESAQKDATTPSVINQPGQRQNFSSNADNSARQDNVARSDNVTNPDGLANPDNLANRDGLDHPEKSVHSDHTAHRANPTRPEQANVSTYGSTHSIRDHPYFHVQPWSEERKTEALRELRETMSDALSENAENSRNVIPITSMITSTPKNGTSSYFWEKFSPFPHKVSPISSEQKNSQNLNGKTPMSKKLETVQDYVQNLSETNSMEELSETLKAKMESLYTKVKEFQARLRK